MKPDRYDPIAAALTEDIGQGDITTDFFVPETLHATGRVTARENAIVAGTGAAAEVFRRRENAIVAGTGAAAEVFRRVDPSIDIQVVHRDGDEVVAGDLIIEVRGLARSILKAERVALNFLQRLCGIATLTRQFVDAIGNHPAKILDTRKTTPGMRALEKAAVVAGGGVNHRFGLYDMVLVKDNHLATFGGLSSFADRIRQLRRERPNIRIEVEADDLEQARAFADVEGIDVILLDNMMPAQMREALALRKGNIQFEASGGITLKNGNCRPTSPAAWLAGRLLSSNKRPRQTMQFCKSRMQIQRRVSWSSLNIKPPGAVSAAIDGNRRQEKDFGFRFFCDRRSISRIRRNSLPGRPKSFPVRFKTNFLSHLRSNLQTTCKLMDARSPAFW